MTSNSQNHPGASLRPPSDNNRISNDAGGGTRTSAPAVGENTDQGREDPSTIEAFDEEGAGIAAKE